MGQCGCCGQVLTVQCPSDCPEVVEYTFENINLNGVGVFDNLAGTVVSFRGIASGNAMAVIALNAVNHTAVITLDANAIVAALPAATTAQVGVLETATDAEALAKGANDKIVTPSNFAAMDSTTTFAGLIEIATNAETLAGLSATLAVPPAGLAAVIATLEQTATFANAVARAAAVPAFDGQLGAQLDTNEAYIATGVGAGNWLLLLSRSNALNATNVSFDMAGGSEFLVETTDLTGLLKFDGVTVTFDAADTTIQNAIFNLSSVDFQIGGASVPGNNLIATSAVAGDLAQYPITAFLSLQNTQTGYTNFSNGATIRTCDTATVTLQQLAQILGTLIVDIKAVLLPAA